MVKALRYRTGGATSRAAKNALTIRRSRKGHRSVRLTNKSSSTGPSTYAERLSKGTTSRQLSAAQLKMFNLGSSAGRNPNQLKLKEPASSSTPPRHTYSMRGEALKAGKPKGGQEQKLTLNEARQLSALQNLFAHTSLAGRGIGQMTSLPVYLNKIQHHGNQVRFFLDVEPQRGFFNKVKKYQAVENQVVSYMNNTGFEAGTFKVKLTRNESTHSGWRIEVTIHLGKRVLKEVSGTIKSLGNWGVTERKPKDPTTPTI